MPRTDPELWDRAALLPTDLGLLLSRFELLAAAMWPQHLVTHLAQSARLHDLQDLARLRTLPNACPQSRQLLLRAPLGPGDCRAEGGDVGVDAEEEEGEVVEEGMIEEEMVAKE